MSIYNINSRLSCLWVIQVHIFNKTVLVDLSHSYQIYRLLFEFLENYLICCMSLYFDI